MSAKDLTAEQRRERGTQLCERLCYDIADVSPRGLGSWGPAWSITDPAMAEFMVRLTAWECDPTLGTLRAVSVSYRGVVEAWREAARRWASIQRETTP